MPFPPPAPVAADQSAVLEQVQQLLEAAPRLAFDKAALVSDPILRDRLRRDAFLAMARTRPADAASLLPQVIQARWLPAVHFAQALDIAEFTVRSHPELSKQLLLASARRHPQIAIREARQFIELPYGPAILDAARQAAALPDAELLLLKIRQNPELAASLPGPEILRLAAAARTEEERETAVRLLRNLSWPEVSNPSTLRGALALLAESGVPLTVPSGVIRAALAGIDGAEDPLAEAVNAASILALSPPDVDDALPSSLLGRLLRAQRNPIQPSLDLASLFPGGVCLQRYIFHNDDDGVESFESFRRGYLNDAKWTVTSHPGFIHVNSSGPGRRVEIFANIPVDLQLPANIPAAAEVAARQQSVTKAIGKRSPAVIVHRGHDHHFDATRKYLQSEARLVFLGSCHGMSNVEDVVTRCRRAQMIATRGIGTTSVNDAFLHALNRRILEPGDTLDWNVFWASLQPSLGSNEHFRAYVPPHKNPSARFLAEFYRHALSAP